MKTFEITEQQKTQLMPFINGKNKADNDLAVAILFLTGVSQCNGLKIEGNTLTINSIEEVKDSTTED